jgi:hypothetical protein
VGVLTELLHAKFPDVPDSRIVPGQSLETRPGLFHREFDLVYQLELDAPDIVREACIDVVTAMITIICNFNLGYAKGACALNQTSIPTEFLILVGPNYVTDRMYLQFRTFPNNSTIQIQLSEPTTLLVVIFYVSSMLIQLIFNSLTCKLF